MASSSNTLHQSHYFPIRHNHSVAAQHPIIAQPPNTTLSQQPIQFTLPRLDGPTIISTPIPTHITQQTQQALSNVQDTIAAAAAKIQIPRHINVPVGGVYTSVRELRRRRESTNPMLNHFYNHNQCKKVGKMMQDSQSYQQTGRRDYIEFMNKKKEWERLKKSRNKKKIKQKRHNYFRNKHNTNNPSPTPQFEPPSPSPTIRQPQPPTIPSVRIPSLASLAPSLRRSSLLSPRRQAPHTHTLPQFPQFLQPQPPPINTQLQSATNVSPFRLNSRQTEANPTRIASNVPIPQLPPNIPPRINSLTSSRYVNSNEMEFNVGAGLVLLKNHLNFKERHKGWDAYERIFCEIRGKHGNRCLACGHIQWSNKLDRACTHTISCSKNPEELC